MGHFSKVQKGKNCRLRSLGFFSSFFFFPQKNLIKMLALFISTQKAAASGKAGDLQFPQQ